jgi:Transposase DDE domain/Domain of unknown function (DUF4372)
MNEGRSLFAQVLEHAPHHHFRRCVERYHGNRGARGFRCWEQFLCMVFAQLTHRESLRDIEACLTSVSDRLYHLGIRGPVRRSTLADANERRDFRIYADFAQILIAEARRLHANEPLDLALKNTVYALDSSTIELCLALFPWAKTQKNDAAVKLHTLLDLRGNIPAFACVTRGRHQDVNLIDEIPLEPGAIYVMDRGYFGLQRLLKIDRAKATFVIRAKKNLKVRRLYSRPVDRTTGLICDQIVVPAVPLSAKRYPKQLRRIAYRDAISGRRFVFMTNDFTLPAFTITRLYKSRWRIELFFKWIKQHLRIKAFYGRSLNAVQTQIWIAICTYVLVAIVRKRLGIRRNLYTLLQVLSVSAFEKTSLFHALTGENYTSASEPDANQLLLFDL